MLIREKKRFIIYLFVLIVFPELVQAQEICLPGNQVTIKELFSVIENQTDYLISYPARNINLNKIITVPSLNARLDHILNQALQETNFTITIRGNYILVVPVEKKVDLPALQLAAKEEPEVVKVSGKDLRNDTDRTVWKLDAPKQPELVVEKPLAFLPDKGLSDEINRTVNSIKQEDSNGLPRLAVRTNLLYGFGTFSPNVGLEAGLDSKSTLLLTGSYNGWRKTKNPEDNKKLWHWTIGGEYRYWPGKRFNGHFFGGHAFYGQYNIAGKKIPFLLEKGSENYRYEGSGVATGVSYGYQFVLGNGWNLEINTGLGVGWLKYDQWDCMRCGDLVAKDRKRFFVAPSKLGITLLYTIK